MSGNIQVAPRSRDLSKNNWVQGGFACQFFRLSGLELPLIQVWAHEVLTMVLEIYKELQKEELSARGIGCRLSLPVKCLHFPSWSGLTLALVPVWVHEELTILL